MQRYVAEGLGIDRTPTGPLIGRVGRLAVKINALNAAVEDV
jgi:hypothetical protein